MYNIFSFIKSGKYRLRILLGLFFILGLFVFSILKVFGLTTPELAWVTSMPASYNPTQLSQRNHALAIDDWNDSSIVQFSTINAGGGTTNVHRDGGTEVVTTQNAAGLISKFNDGGEYLWSKVLVGEDTNGQADDDVIIHDGTFDTNGNILAVGQFSSDLITLIPEEITEPIEEQYEQVVFDFASSVGQGDVASLSWEHTVGEGDNSILVVGVAARENANVVTATYAGQNLSKINDQGSLDVRAELWYLLDPPEGSAQVVINLDRTQSVSAGSVSYFGIDQSNPINNHDSMHVSPAVDAAGMNITGHPEGLYISVVALQSVNLLRNVQVGQNIRVDQTSTANHLGMSDQIGLENPYLVWSIEYPDFWAFNTVAFNPAIDTSEFVPEIVYDNSSYQSNDGTTNSLTWEHTTGAADRRILLVGTGTRGASAVGSITYAGIDLSPIILDRSNFDVQSELWYLLDPPSGTHELVANFSTVQNLSAGAITYSGVDQDEPIFEEGDADDWRWLDEASTSLTRTIESVEGGVVVGAIALQSRNTSLAAGENQNSRVQPLSSAGVLNMSDVFGSGEQSLEWTYTGDYWASFIVSLRPYIPVPPTPAVQISAGDSTSPLLIEYDADGNFLWANTQPNADISYNTVNSYYTHDDTILVSGYFKGIDVNLNTSNADDSVDLYSTPEIEVAPGVMEPTTQPFISLFTSNGDYLFSKVFSSDAVLDPDVPALEIIGAEQSWDNIVITGNYLGEVELDFTNEEPELYPDGQNDPTIEGDNESNMFVAVFDKLGNYLNSTSTSGTGFVENKDMIFNGNRIITSGTFLGTTDFGDSEQPSIHLSELDNQYGDGYVSSYYYDWWEGTLEHEWTRTISGVGYESINAVTLGLNNSILLHGISTTPSINNIDFDPSPGKDIFNLGSANPLFLTRFTSSGFYDWTYTFGNSTFHHQNGHEYLASDIIFDFQQSRMLISGQTGTGDTVDFSIGTESGQAQGVYLASYEWDVGNGSIGDPWPWNEYDDPPPQSGPPVYTTQYDLPADYKNIGSPYDIVALPDGTSWYVDSMNSRIVKIGNDGSILRTVGRAGDQDGEFAGTPRSIAVDNDGFLYVLSQNCRIDVFDSNGGYLRRFGSCGPDENQLQMTAGSAYPHSIHYDQTSNTILISDTVKHRIAKFSKSGTYINSFGGYGTANGKFNQPAGVTTDSNGNIFVVDEFNHRIQVFDQQYNFLRSFGEFGTEVGQLRNPKDIEILSNGEMFVTSQNSQKILKFDAEANFSFEITQFGDEGQRFYHPQYITVDADEYIWVTDWYHNFIQVFDQDGNHVQSIQNAGLGNGKFSEPTDVEFDEQGNLYILDKGTASYDYARIQKFNNIGEFQEEIVVPEEVGEAVYFMKYLGANTIPQLPFPMMFVSGTAGVGVIPLTTYEYLPFPVDDTFDEARGIDILSRSETYEEDEETYEYQYIYFIIADLFNHRFQTSYLSLLNGNYDYGYSDSFGIVGSNRGRFTEPESLIYNKFITDDLHIIVADKNRVSVLTNYGEFLRELWNMGVVGNSIISKQLAMGGENGELIFVSNTCRVQVFSAETYQYLFSVGSCGSGIDQFADVRGLEFNPLNRKQFFVADRVNNRVSAYGQGVRIVNLISSTDVVEESDQRSLVKTFWNPEDEGIDNLSSALYFGDYIVSDFNVDLSETRDWSKVNAMISSVADKSLIVNLDPENSPGVSETHSLYVIKEQGQIGVRICPEATALEEISDDCDGGYDLEEGASGLEVVNRGGIEYWRINDLTGTGAMAMVESGGEDPGEEPGDNDDDEDDDGEESSSGSDDDDEDEDEDDDGEDEEQAGGEDGAPSTDETPETSGAPGAGETPLPSGDEEVFEQNLAADDSDSQSSDLGQMKDFLSEKVNVLNSTVVPALAALRELPGLDLAVAFSSAAISVSTALLASTASLGLSAVISTAAAVLREHGLLRFLDYLTKAIMAALPFFVKKGLRTGGNPSLVLDAVTRQPLAAAYLLFYSKSGNLKSAVSNQDGCYQVELVPDQYELKCTRDQYRQADSQDLTQLKSIFNNLYNPNEKIIVEKLSVVSLVIGLMRTKTQSGVADSKKNHLLFLLVLHAVIGALVSLLLSAPAFTIFLVFQAVSVVLVLAGNAGSRS